ncbi:MAG: tetratricopeptide repeat protein [Phycisphaerae bacterium]|nr:tetratricopeptide repeat protein [Phycisphaerae bacterium]
MKSRLDDSRANAAGTRRAVPAAPRGSIATKAMLMGMIVLSIPGALDIPLKRSAQAEPRAVAAALSAAEDLRQTAARLIAEEKIDAALEAAQRALQANPADDRVREEFVALHLALARRLVADERFALAEKTLEAAERAQPSDPEPRDLLHRIAAGRAAAPVRVETARKWLALEWYEPAFVTFRQAVALVPSHRREWLSSFYQASIGAGDDEYITKNFHTAAFHYDAALKLGDELGLAPTAALLDRWLQCLAHALARDIDRTIYPPEFWKLSLQRAATVGGTSPGSDRMLAVLRGLAYENLGEPGRAANEYARFLGRPATESAAAAQDLRNQVMASLRQRYDIDSCGRRRGFWQHADPGEPRVLPSDRFRIHHRNERVAELVAEAVRFHFARIADLLSLDIGEIPWQAPCDIFIHVDARSFREALGHGRDVRAASVIDSSGRRLVRHEIHLYQQDPMMLSASLSHELAHLMIAARNEYRPMPAVISEGLALHVEPKCRRRQFARLFHDLPRPRKLGLLLNISQTHPPEAEFYCEAYQFVDVLASRGGLGRVLEINDKEASLAQLTRLFQFASSADLEAAYLANWPGVKSEQPR